MTQLMPINWLLVFCMRNADRISFEPVTLIPFEEHTDERNWVGQYPVNVGCIVSHLCLFMLHPIQSDTRQINCSIPCTYWVLVVNLWDDREEKVLHDVYDTILSWPYIDRINERCFDIIRAEATSEKRMLAVFGLLVLVWPIFLVSICFSSARFF